MRRLFALPVLLGLVVAACGGSQVDGFPVIASAPGTVGTGEQRVLVAVIDLETDGYLASPDIAVTATLRNENGSPLDESEGLFVWTVPDVRGIYSFRFDIPEAGTYQVTMDSEEFGSLGPVGLVAFENPVIVAPGEPAPRSETRTVASHDITEISSDPDPDPAFYEMSVAEAVESGPSVIVFATPAWCTTQACGPMLDQVQEMAPEYPDLNFVHVEVYEDIGVESFEDLELVPAILDWGLPSEPWIFVTDGSGMVAAAFEGAVSDVELRAALDSVSP